MTYTLTEKEIIITSTYHNATLMIQEGSTPQAQAEAYIAEHIKTIDELKQIKRESIIMQISEYERNGTVLSSTGYEVNARQKDVFNIDELIKMGVTTFRFADNVSRPVTAEQLATIRGEIVAAGFEMYQRKWDAEAAIEAATTENQLAAITL